MTPDGDIRLHVPTGATMSSAGGFEPGKLWSLWDIMNNFSIIKMHTALTLLKAQQLEALRKSLPSPIGTLDEETRVTARKIFELCQEAFQRFDNAQIRRRIESFGTTIEAKTTRWADYDAECRFLADALLVECDQQYFHHYQPEKAALLKSFIDDWNIQDGNLRQPVREHALAAVDCYALDHSTACVFHLMMAMEIGVRTFGTKLGVDLAVVQPGRKVHELTWNQILDALNPKFKALPQGTVAEKRKYEKYSAVQTYLYRVADAWRNPTMHPRDSGYNGLEALNIINLVRPFMHELDALLRL